ncbi:hypothetical protein [Streptomyces sp. NPDC018610]|uniref:hypothetical protein n=1 Tax=Streptomyces sp. NPDC018610 TaxID=3365049 RepID=UPI00378F1152
MEISVAAIARRSGVDRTFLYRHRDLLAQVHAQPPAIPGPAVSRASLQADLLAADARTARLAAHVRRLEACLSGALGEQVRHESGIGGPEDTEQLKARITTLEQQVIDLELEIQDRDDDLAANRELMAQLNRHTAARARGIGPAADRAAIMPTATAMRARRLAPMGHGLWRSEVVDSPCR